MRRRQGDAKKEGAWSDEETERLRQAVADYLAARTAAEGGPGGSQEEGAATLTLEDIQGGWPAARRLSSCFRSALLLPAARFIWRGGHPAALAVPACCRGPTRQLVSAVRLGA